jgi:hypothetical protein
MKNMTLPVRNFNLLLCALLLFAAGCKDKNAPETFASDQPRPTWTAPEKTDMTSSMTAVVKVDLAAQYPETAADFVLDDNDLLAAFSGETCLGVASAQDGLFFLYIAGTEGAVTLRYYSAHYKNLFEAKDAFPYHNDDHLGTPDSPLIPTFVVVKQQ